MQNHSKTESVVFNFTTVVDHDLSLYDMIYLL